jgi:hypothetical protein
MFELSTFAEMFVEMMQVGAAGRRVLGAELLLGAA